MAESDVAIAVSVATGDRFARAGLETLVQHCGFSVAEAGDGDVVVWDSTGGEPMPSLALVLALTTDEDRAQEALSGGARAAITRTAAPNQIAAAVRAVASGLIVIDPAFARLVVPKRPVSPKTEGLTPREGEALQLLAEGLSNKQIGVRLGVSEHTAKFHVMAVLNKLGATTRTEAVVLAARWGLLML